MTREIPLSRGQVAIVDDIDYDRVNQYKWYAKWRGQTQSWIAARNERPVVGGPQRTVYMARFIVGATERSQFVDHRNHNTLDNTRQNIRVSTPTQNNQNKRRYKNSRSKYKCVYKCRGGYRSYINVDGQRVRLKPRPTEYEAYIEYCLAAIQYFGQYSCFDCSIPTGES